MNEGLFESVFARRGSGDPASALEVERRDIGDCIVLFGAGNLGRRVLQGLRSAGAFPQAFIDNDSRLWDREIEGLRVLSPVEGARRFSTRALFVVTIWQAGGATPMAARVRQLRELGCKRVTTFGSLMRAYSEVFLPHFQIDSRDRLLSEASLIKDAFSLWSDEASRREFLAQVRFRLDLDFDALGPPADHEIYFPFDLFSLHPRETFVDVGAYNGDTLRRFLHHTNGAFESAVAFEPDPANFESLSRYVFSLPNEVKGRIELVPKGLGARREEVAFEATGGDMSRAGTGSSRVEVVTLDECGIHPTFIKMDVEGFELEALIGAEEVIRRDRPILALSAYHLQNHLWRIPLFVRSLCDEYDFFLRPHRKEGWDLVCYAIPRRRMNASEGR